ncbi:EF-hand domain-containing protein [Bosea psychrotolerans]|uniref:Ca2+-binding EF-hand superfamily protein n=1 Tax=Bosea psychrotolerans TaxID=1871628 RepID=A0A2S4LZN6_9HYPH|nr:EF-hand domain-containing protein [Bosea psychrotolerans]POR47809.1 Ca2+-binding EF-hand superfamily protein [Bosea psychrotolerans]
MSSIGSVGGFRPPPPKPPSFDTLDSNSSGSLSLDEFQSGAPKGTDSAKSEALFKAIDSDSDGSVTKAESDAFKAKAEKAGQQLQSFLFGLQSGQTSSASDSTTSGGTDIFSQIDANSDGSIAKDEFTQAFSTGTSDSTSALGDLFDAIDSDSDGSISKDEQSAFQDTLKAAGPPPPPPPQDASSESSDDQDIFSQLDANSDGSVAKDEFLSALNSDKTASGSSDLLSKLFDAIDSDKNGSISKDEQTAFQQASDKRGPPPQPPAAFLNASQSYGNVYQLGSASSATSSYSQAA